MAVLLLLVSACGQEPIRIGVSGQLSGVYSDFAVQGRNGARLAVEEINARGGIGGHRLELVTADDGGTPQGAVEADRRLMGRGVVAIIGHMTSDRCLAALANLQGVGVPMISPTASSPQLSGKRDLFFRVQPSIEKVPQMLAHTLAEHRPFAKVCTVRDRREANYTGPWEEAFARAYRSSGGSFLCRLTYSRLDQSNMERISESLSSSRPDAVVLVSSAQDAARLAGLVLRCCPNTLIYAASWAQTDDLLTHRKEGVEQIRIATDILPLDASDALRRFAWNYRKRYGVPPSFAAVRSYEAVRLLAAALSRVGNALDRLPQTLTRLGPVPGLYGPIELDSFGDAVGTLYVVGVRSGKFVVLEQLGRKES
ncbi:ABC transporter substrate-binding protein [Desulfacinum hydrothermale]|nr:ABC transporter substrate-binding protein [Desulfacinum hydrothermale]